MRSFYIAEIYKNTGRQVKYNQENKRENKTAAKTKKIVNKKPGNTPNAEQKRFGAEQQKKEGNDETFICI